MSGSHRAIRRPAAATGDAAKQARGRAVTVALIVLLCGLLGFGVATQVRRTAAGDSLAGMRPDDLVQILDRLHRREEQLTAEVVDLQNRLAQLRAGGAASGRALAEAERQAAQLAILAGTTPATGPGVIIEIKDPATSVSAETLLDTLQELRNAGAEAIQVGSVRVGFNSAFSGPLGSIVFDGIAISPPYRILAIGDPPTLAAAMAIPGGVIDTVRRTNAEISIVQGERIVVDALRSAPVQQYARPTG